MVYDLLIHVLLYSGIVISAIGLVILIVPNLFLKIMNVLNVWVDTSSFFAYLDKQKSSERFFYRHHRILGGLICLAGIYIFYSLTFQYGGYTKEIDVVLIHSKPVTNWLISALVFFNQCISILLILLGPVIVVRPSQLKDIERRLNIWISTELSDEFDRLHKEPDSFFARKPRFTGILLLLGGGYLFLSSLIMLLK